MNEHLIIKRLSSLAYGAGNYEYGAAMFECAVQLSSHLPVHLRRAWAPAVSNAGHALRTLELPYFGTW